MLQMFSVKSKWGPPTWSPGYPALTTQQTIWRALFLRSLWSTRNNSGFTKAWTKQMWRDTWEYYLKYTGASTVTSNSVSYTTFPHLVSHRVLCLLPIAGVINQSHLEKGEHQKYILHPRTDTVTLMSHSVANYKKAPNKYLIWSLYWDFASPFMVRLLPERAGPRRWDRPWW